MLRPSCTASSFPAHFPSDLVRQEEEVSAWGAECETKESSWDMGREVGIPWRGPRIAHCFPGNLAVLRGCEMVCDYTLPLGSVRNLSPAKGASSSCCQESWQSGVRGSDQFRAFAIIGLSTLTSIGLTDCISYYRSLTPSISRTSL